ncbi:MAG TPA: SDR family oxidoreductase [Terriglobia bacterium]|nr:SDR family oxidoreductase [Terriglobia bacterium]
MELAEYARHPSLKEKTVFITGGGTGIGAAIVESFLDQGSKVAFIDIEEAASTALCDQLQAQYGVRPLFIRCDIRDVVALQQAVARASSALGDVGVLVNNAASDTRHDWREVTPDYWDDRMAINLRPLFFAIQAVAPGMQRNGGGSIINFGSISWMKSTPGMPAYTSAKAAIHGLTRSFARELGADGIRVNTVVPGWVMTERQMKLWLDEAGEREIEANQCTKGRVMPVDLARMVLFLASKDSEMCTAQQFIVDGGWV